MNKKLKFSVIVATVIITMSLGIIYEQFSEKVTAEKLMDEVLNSKNIETVSFDGVKTENSDVISKGYGEIDLKNRKIHLYTENIKKKTSTEIYFVDNATYIKIGDAAWFKPKYFVSFDTMFDSQDENFDLSSFTLASSNESILVSLTSFYYRASNVTLNLKGEENIDGQKCQVIEGIHFVNSRGGQWEYERRYWINKSTHKLIQMDEVIPKFENLRNETTTRVKYQYNTPVKIILPEEAKDAKVVDNVQSPSQIEIGMKGGKTAAKVGVNNNTTNKTETNEQ